MNQPATDNVVPWSKRIKFDQGRHPRAKIGFVLLATEQTVQDDILRIFPEGIGTHFTRVAIPDDIRNETLLATAEGLPAAASLILPDGSLQVVCYACTSGTIVIGEERVVRLLQVGAPGANATSLYGGVRKALTKLGVKKLVMATPYLDEINKLEADTLARDGFDLLAYEGLQIQRDSDMVKVDPQFILDFAASLDRPEAEAIFISCGALRSIDIIEALEARTGKPVVTSNQAMAWDCLRMAGITDSIDGYGTLLRSH